MLETLRAAPPWALRALAAGGRHGACALSSGRQRRRAAAAPAAARAAPRPPLALDELGALHSAALCEVLQRPPPAAPPAEFARRRGGGGGGGGGRRRLLLWGAVRARTSPTPRRRAPSAACRAAPRRAARGGPRRGRWPAAAPTRRRPTWRAAAAAGSTGCSRRRSSRGGRGRAVDAGALCATADGGGCRALLLRPPLVVSARARGADAADALAAAQVAATAEPWLEPLGLLAECVERLRPGLERTAGAGAAAASRASG